MLTVVKVGGSYAHSLRLPDLVAALAQGAGRAVIVPGGGPFADCVRREQPRIGYDGHAAHRMALLAMAQFGMALASLALREASQTKGRTMPAGPQVLVPAASPRAIEAVRAKRNVPIWLPLDLLDGDAELPESWEMTSDSLAAWLAGKLGAARLFYLKSTDVAEPASAAELAAKGLLDPLAPKFLAAGGAEVWLCGPREIAELGAALAAGSTVGRRIAVA
jgi:aspartokinase-like uncharacterized kinase